MNFCPQCRQERQEKIPADVSTRTCAFHAAELALSAGVAQFTDRQRKTWLITIGIRDRLAPGFFQCIAGGNLLVLHYSEIEVRKQ